MADNVPTTTTPAAAPTGNGVAPAAAEPKPLVIGGLSFRNENEAKAEIERGRQSNKLLTQAERRNLEAAKREKDWEGLVSEVKTKKDAKRVIEKLGLSKEEAVEIFGRYVYETEVLPKELSPEQRRIRELEAEKAARDEEKATEAKAKEQREHEEMTTREAQKLRGELEKVLTDKKVPATRLALRRLANYLAAYNDAGADIPVDRAADLVAEDYKQEFGELFDESSPEQLVEFFGKEKWLKLAKKVSQWALASKKEPGTTTSPPIENRPVQKSNQNDKMTPQEFAKWSRGVK